MAQNSKGAEVQAMPIESNTIVGIVTAVTPQGGTIQVIDDCILTFEFNNKSIVIDAIAGSNFQAGIGCISITSTAEIILT